MFIILWYLFICCFTSFYYFFLLNQSSKSELAFFCPFFFFFNFFLFLFFAFFEGNKQHLFNFQPGVSFFQFWKAKKKKGSIIESFFFYSTKNGGGTKMEINENCRRIEFCGKINYRRGWNFWNVYLIDEYCHSLTHSIN